MSRVSVVVLHGGHSRQRSSWAVVRKLTGPQTEVTAFFEGPVPPGRPKRVSAFVIEPTPAPSRRRVADYVRWRALHKDALAVAEDPGSDPLWRRAVADQRLRAAIGDAEVVVAANWGAVPTAWHLRDLNPAADVILGPGEALRRIARRAR
ncbi:MAG: hypothetical protein U0R64_01175 [Candidatus Nanopelagicales bacterium]